MKIATALAVCLTLFAGQPSYAQKLCPGLSGKERTRCLKEQQVQDERNRANANQQYESSKSLHESGCKVDKGLRAGAGAASAAKGGKGKDGKLAYDAGRALGSALAGPDGCPR